MEPRERTLVFDYQTARLAVGIIAFILPPVVIIFSHKPLSSISDSYYSNARDLFVGMLFIVGSFLLAYNGHGTGQKIASKIASIAAILVALFPTNCDGCLPDIISKVHYCSATVLFAILAYFCLWPFRIEAAKKEREKNNKKAGRRKIIYIVCGSIMLACMLAAGISMLAKIGTGLRITYWAETGALAAFGTAWMMASRFLKVIAEENEKLVLLRKRVDAGRKTRVDSSPVDRSEKK